MKRDIGLFEKNTKEEIKINNKNKNKNSYNYENDVVVNDADKIKTYAGGMIVVRTVFEDEGDYIWDMYQHEEEWREVDRLVDIYQAQFKEDAAPDARERADKAGIELLERFHPLFKKYVILLTTGQINFKNTEQRQFVKLFMDKKHLQQALNRKNPGENYREQISQLFNFIIEGYGHKPEEEIYDDMRVIFLLLLKRYKNIGRSFCCYVYNLFKYEVCRMIQKYQKNPINFHYKIATLDECARVTVDDYSEIEDSIYEDDMGLPDMSWVKGETCSDLFSQLTSEERIIISKYYLQDWADKQIAELLDMHINTVNQRRKAATKHLAELLGVNPKNIIRHRNSGKKAIIGFGL